MKYLVSPYSDPDPAIREFRYIQVMHVASKLLQEGEWIYSSILYCHDMAIRFGLPTDFAFWRQYNFHMIDLAESLLVLPLSGYTESRGVAAELEYAKNTYKLIRFIHAS